MKIKQKIENFISSFFEIPMCETTLIRIYLGVICFIFGYFIFQIIKTLTR